MYSATDNTPFDFGKYNLRVMGNIFFTRDLTLDEAKDEQDTMFKKIEDLKLRANPKKVGLKLGTNNLWLKMQKIFMKQEDKVLIHWKVLTQKLKNQNLIGCTDLKKIRRFDKKN